MIAKSTGLGAGVLVCTVQGMHPTAWPNDQSSDVARRTRRKGLRIDSTGHGVEKCFRERVKLSVLMRSLAILRIHIALLWGWLRKCASDQKIDPGSL
jgi:hypothetical protein